MWQLSRQNISRQTIGRQFFLKRNIYCLKNKTGPVRFEPRNFGVTGVFVTSRPSALETQRKFTISNIDRSVNKVIYGKKV